MKVTGRTTNIAEWHYHTRHECSLSKWKQVRIKYFCNMAVTVHSHGIGLDKFRVMVNNLGFIMVGNWNSFCLKLVPTGTGIDTSYCLPFHVCLSLQTAKQVTTFFDRSITTDNFTWKQFQYGGTKKQYANKMITLQTAFVTL